MLDGIILILHHFLGKYYNLMTHKKFTAKKRRCIETKESHALGNKGTFDSCRSGKKEFDCNEMEN